MSTSTPKAVTPAAPPPPPPPELANPARLLIPRQGKGNQAGVRSLLIGGAQPTPGM